ncbi:hypothetical protein J2W70_004546 [Pseudomonas koreensis]|nr:hypothetical protein [Pseudomonas koreensis]
MQVNSPSVISTSASSEALDIHFIFFTIIVVTPVFFARMEISSRHEGLNQSYLS